MDNNEMDFINKILDGDNGYLESIEPHQTLEEIDEKREESLFYIYENYLDSEQNKENLSFYVENMKEYEYIDDPNDLYVGNYIRYPMLDDLTNIQMHRGGYIAKINSTDKDGNQLPHLLMLKSPVKRDDANGIKKYSYWNIYKDSIIFRKLNQDDKLNASIAELMNDLSLN